MQKNNPKRHKIEDRWENNIGEGVACWVSDEKENPDSSCKLLMVIGYEKNSWFKYITTEGKYYYATPVGEEIEKYLLKNR